MQRFWPLLLLLLLTASLGQAQPSAAAPVDYTAWQPFAPRLIVPLGGLYLLCNFVLAAIRLILNFLLKKQIITAAVSERVVERLLPGPQDEQNRVVKRIALLVSLGTGLLLCNWYLPLGLHSLVILLFTTALGYLVYFFFLRRQVS